MQFTKTPVSILLQEEDSDDDDGVIDKTTKCNQFQFQEFIGDVTACEREATKELEEFLASDSLDLAEFRRAICSAVTGKVKRRGRF